MNRIQKYDRKRWFAAMCCKPQIKPPELPGPGIPFAIGLAVTMMLMFSAVALAASSVSLPHAAGLAIAAVSSPDIHRLRAMAAQIPPNIETKEGVPLEQQLATISSELKAAVAESKTATGNRLSQLESKINDWQRQLDAIDLKLADRHGLGGGPAEKTLLEHLNQSEDIARLKESRRGTARLILKGADAQLLEHKTVIDSAAVGRSTSGVLQIDRMPGITPEARQVMKIRNLLTSIPTSLQIIDYLKVNSGISPASMQVESSAKAENAVTFTTASARVETVATWIPASNQVLSDMSELAAFIRSSLIYAVDQRIEAELLFGSGVSPDLNGLFTQATPFNTALLPYTPGWNKSDMISCAIQQIQLAKEVDPTFIVIHPTDYWSIIRTKDANKNYIFGNNGMVDPFWGLKPVLTTSMSSGLFLVGNGNPDAVVIRTRQETVVEISTENEDFFLKNKVAIRGESRLALVVRRPGSFIYGTFASSP